jgi:outer membrane lipoprotein-sorting protein
MTMWHPRTLSAVVLVALVLLSTATGGTEPPSLAMWGLPRLMAGMRTVQGATASFSERKFDRLLKQPLQSSGRLIFVAPDQLQKETLAPVPSRLTVKGDRLTVVQPDGKTRTLSLSEYPALGALIESARATLAGDGATLARYYTTTLTGDAQAWTLLLEPRDDRLRAILTGIRIQGAGNTIRGIETQERDGDRTEMTIVPERP